MWLHYSANPISQADLHDSEQSDTLTSYSKPNGFWITDDSDSCWRSWCVAEGFGLGRLTHKHGLELNERRILILRNASALDRFTKKFAAERFWGPDNQPRKWRDLCLDWREVAKKYAGIIIAPYQWQRRLHDGYSWYYTWDCASGCIWDVSAILDIRLLEIDHEVIKAKEDAE